LRQRQINRRPWALLDACNAEPQLPCTKKKNSPVGCSFALRLPLNRVKAAEANKKRSLQPNEKYSINP
jgi:hypothetical protein